MVCLHRLNGEEIWLNAALVEYVHATPDTMIVLLNGHIATVRESVSDVVLMIEAALGRIGLGGLHGQQDT